MFSFALCCPQNSRYQETCFLCPIWQDCELCTVQDPHQTSICTEALDHTSSPLPNSTLETLSLDKGYWRYSLNSTTILPCHHQDACVGGVGNGGDDDYCADGYTGPCERALRNGCCRQRTDVQVSCHVPCDFLWLLHVRAMCER